jgi:hypothetical protein
LLGRVLDVSARDHRKDSRVAPRFCRTLALLAVATALTCARGAAASDALNSSDKPQHTGDDGQAHDEFNVLPVAGGTTDIGIGGGYFAGLARMKAGYDPYVWNLESAGLVTFKLDNGHVILPYQDVYFKLTIPRLFDAPLRLEIRPEYSWETTLGYFGIGNAAPAPLPAGSKYNEYSRLHPEIVAEERWRIVDHVAGNVGLGYSQSWLHFDANSKLAEDLRSGSAEVKSLLGSMNSHSVVTGKIGIQFDDRDDEVSTHRGTYDSLTLKVSPGAGTLLPYRYAQVTAIARGFLPIVGRRLVLAARLVGDVLIGDPPFYELSRFDDTYAIGGENGVRGVPGQRYYGKAKVFGNAELRSEIVSFHALGKPLIFGVVALCDAGRVWADTSPHPELDGTGLGLKYGVGGGLRLQSGSSFVLRADIVWSPDASPIGGYFSAGQMF